MKIFLPSPASENNLGMLGPKRDLLALLFSKGCLGNSFVSHLQHAGPSELKHCLGSLVSVPVIISFECQSLTIT